jgi:hypothetical protein
MGKLDMQRTHKTPAHPAQRRPAAERTAAPGRAAALANHRPEALARRRLAQAISHSPRMLAQRQQFDRLFGHAAPPAHLVQLKDLTDKEIEAIDRKAWDTAVAATRSVRPENQEPVRIDGGANGNLDADTLIRGKDNQTLQVTYYPQNDSFSRTNRSVRLGQMAALFNHELAYHGSREVIGNYNTDDENPDDEHFAMFDPARRDDLLATTVAALEEMTDAKARLAYINWWEADVKEHADWDDSRKPSERLEAKKWATKTARALRRRFVSKGRRPGRNDPDRSHRGAV